MPIGTFNPSFNGQVTRGQTVDETFATIRAGAGVGTNVGANELVHLHGNVTTDHFDYNYRYIVHFDTSSIGADKTVTAATFDVYVNSKVNNEGMTNLALVKPTPASATDVIAADYNIANWPATRQATDLSIAGITTSARNIWTLNATGLANINKVGTTTLGLIFSNDVDDSGATWQSDDDSLVNGDYAADTNKPQLIVTYVSGGSGLQNKIW